MGVLKTNYELIYNMLIMFFYIGLALTQPMSVQRKPMARSYILLNFFFLSNLVFIYMVLFCYLIFNG